MSNNIANDSGPGPGGAGRPGVVSNSDRQERARLGATFGSDSHEEARSGATIGRDARNQRSEIVGRGRRWTMTERRFLWECFERSGGVWTDGYIEKVKSLWDEGEFSGRTLPSLISQMKEIRSGRHLTEMDKDEIRQRVELQGRMLISAEQWDEYFGESDSSQFLGFESDDGQREVDIDFATEEIVEGGTESLNQEERTVVFKESNGDSREATEEEKEVYEKMKIVYEGEETKEVPSLRAQDRKKVNKEIRVVEGLMSNFVTEGMTVTRVNRLLYTGAFVVAERLGMMRTNGNRDRRVKPKWQRRIEKSIEEWRKDLGRIDELRRGTVLGKAVMDRLNRKYQVVEKGALTVTTMLKRKVQSGSMKIRWYLDNCTKVRQNTLFKNNQSQLYKELGGRAQNEPAQTPDAEASTQFWKGIWEVEKRHNEGAAWLGEVRGLMRGVDEQENVTITTSDVVSGIRKMANWKAPGPDGVRGFWFKRFVSLHGGIAMCLQECLEKGEVPPWMVLGRTVLIQKDKSKRTVVSNYRPIACLPLMWKLLTGILAEKLYGHLLAGGLLMDEQKGCRKRSRGTKDQLLIDKTVLKEAKGMKRSLAMGWIDYRKAYDMVPHSWIVEMLNLTKVAENVKTLLIGSMDNWKTMLTSNGERLGEVGIKRGIFQGDSLSPLLFILAMMPLTLLLRRERMGYKFGSEKRNVNHLLFMDDLKLYGKNEEELERLVEVVKTFSNDIGMEFGMDKCAVLVLKRGVKTMCEGIRLPDNEVMKEVDEEGYKYLGVLEGADIMQKEMKEKVRQEYLKRVKLVAKSKLYGGNLIKAVNAWAVAVVRYSAGILEWKDRELKAMDVRTRKLLTMFGAYHMKSSVPRLYMKRKEGGRGLISVYDCVRTEEVGLFGYVKDSNEWMLKVVGETLEVNETKAEYKQRVERERVDCFSEKVLHGKFFRDVKEVADPRSWQWLRSGYLGKTTEGYVCAAQEQGLRTRFFRASIQKEAVDPTCRMCKKEVESVGHLASGCSGLAQREYRRRHDRMGLRVYWELCRKHGMKHADVWYKEVPDEVRMSDDKKIEIWWDRSIETTQRMDHNRPDVVVLDHTKKAWTLIDFSVPWDKNVILKEDEKLDHYSPLAREIRRMHHVTTKVVPLVIGSLGVVSKRFEGYMKELEIGDVLGGMQASAIIGTTLILQKVLSL